MALCLLCIMGRPALAASLEDANHQTITLADAPRRILPAGPPAQILLHALAPGQLAGLVEGFPADAAIYVDPALLARPRVPMAARSHDKGDFAEITRLKPDLILDYGSVEPRYAHADADVAGRLAVPVLLFDGRLEAAPDLLLKLGRAFGDEARARMLSERMSKILADTRPLADLPEAERVPVYLARGADGLTGARAGSAFDEPLRLAGARNVVAGGIGAFRRMRPEEVLALHPKVVIFEDREALSSPLGKALPPDVTVLLDNGVPYKALTGAPSLNRMVGLVALASILHPDRFHMDPEDVPRVETLLFPIPPGLAAPAPLARVR